MSTRCRIAKQLDENKYKSIYCHFDGYPDGVGATLITCYKDPAKIDKLINLGDISYIAPNVDPDPNKPHSFDDPQENVVVAYGRDRGEKNVDPVVSDSFDDLQDLCANCWAEYLYVYDLDNVWNTYDTYGNPVNESDSFFGKVKTYLKEEESDATGIDIHNNINRALDDFNKCGGDILYEFISFDDDFNYLKLRAYALGPDGEDYERDVQLKLDGISRDSIYEAIDTWDSEHKSPDNFYESDSSFDANEPHTMEEVRSYVNNNKSGGSILIDTYSKDMPGDPLTKDDIGKSVYDLRYYPGSNTADFEYYEVIEADPSFGYDNNLKFEGNADEDIEFEDFSLDLTDEELANEAKKILGISLNESASKGSKFKITPNKSDDIWLTFEGSGVKGSAKVYDIPSDYGIKYSNISKLSYNGKDKCNYDRGWDVVPKDTKLLDSLCKALIDYRINNLYDVDDMTVEEIKEKNNSYNYDNETHNFEESEKLKESDEDKYKQKFKDYCKDKLVDSLGTVEVETDDWDSDEVDAKKTVSVNVVATQEIRDFGECKILDDNDLYEKLDNDSGNLGFVKANGELIITPMTTSYGLIGRLQFDKITKDYYTWILDSWDDIYMDECMDEIEESEKLKESEWHTWMHDDPSTTYGFKNQYGYTINQLQIDDEAKEYRVGSFTQSNDKTITRKKFYQMIEELEAAGYKKVEYWSNRQGAGSNTSNIINEAGGSKEYTLVNADSDKISELEKGSALTWEGMNTTPKNLKAIVGVLKKDTPIKLPVTFYTWTGKEFNDKYGLTGNNAYPEDLPFLSISLDNWSEMGNLPFWKMQVGARWLDDIVDNNARRQGTSSTVDDEEE